MGRKFWIFLFSIALSPNIECSTISSPWFINKIVNLPSYIFKNFFYKSCFQVWNEMFVFFLYMSNVVKLLINEMSLRTQYWNKCDWPNNFQSFLEVSLLKAMSKWKVKIKVWYPTQHLKISQNNHVLYMCRFYLSIFIICKFSILL